MRKFFQQGLGAIAFCEIIKLCPAVAASASIPDATLSYFTDNNGQQTSNGTGTINGIPGAVVTQSGASLLPAGSAPSLNASVSGAANFASASNERASAGLDYSFSLTGPSSNSPVPVMVTAVNRASGSSTNQGSFEISTGLNISGRGVSVVDNIFFDTQSGKYSYSADDEISQIIYLYPGQVYEVQMSVYLSEDSYSVCSLDVSGCEQIYQRAQATAFVDPSFQLASSVTDPQDYSFQFSPGVGNALAGSMIAVPGPVAGAGLLPLLGFGGAWFSRRRDRRSRTRRIAERTAVA